MSSSEHKQRNPFVISEIISEDALITERGLQGAVKEGEMRNTSQKHAYIVLTPLNPTFIK